MSRDLKFVTAAMLAWGLGEGMFYIFLPLYIQEFGADSIMIGTILGVNGIVMTLAQIPSGYLADRWGRRPIMWFCWITGVLATTVMALAPSLAIYVVGLLLYGLTSAVMAPLNTYVQDVRGKWSVGRAVSFVSAAYNIGGILGPFLGGLLADRFSLRLVYGVAAVVFFISTVIVFLIRKQTQPQAVDVRPEGHLLKNRRFLGLLVITFLIMFAVYLPQPLAANFLKNQRDLSLSRIGQLGALGGLGSVLLMLIFGHLSAGVALVIGQAAVGLFALFLWRGSGLIWYGAAYIALGGFRLCRAMTVALVRPVVDELQVGFAFGLVESLNSFSFVIVPPLAGLLYDWRPVVIFPVSLVVLALTLILSFRLIGRKNRQAPVDMDG
jgi:MFS family permease